MKGTHCVHMVSVFQMIYLFQETALMEIYVLLAARMLVSDETLCFASRSSHSRAVSPGCFGKRGCF